MISHSRAKMKTSAPKLTLVCKRRRGKAQAPESGDDQRRRHRAMAAQTSLLRRKTL